MIVRPRTFPLVENMPRKNLTSLRREGYSATRVYDVSLRSQPDAAIFAYTRAYQTTIITFDTDYLNQTAFPPPHAGILVLHSFPRNTTVNELASALKCRERHLLKMSSDYGSISAGKVICFSYSPEKYPL